MNDRGGAPPASSPKPQLSERQRELVLQGREAVIQTAQEIAAGMGAIDPDDREAVYRAAYARTKWRLAAALAVIDELTGGER